MANQISIIVQAKDQASAVLGKVGKNLKQTGSQAEKSSAATQRASLSWAQFAALAASASIASRSLIGFISSTTTSANRLQAALTGLNSVARHFGQDATKAKKAAQALASDGLMTVAESATGLKNLLAAGFNLDQAITLMKRFKDSAAFGRQASLSFGQAITSATEGVKNGNSILVDNAGVTKNLSIMLEEAGYSAQDLMRATSDAGVRQAIFNGIVRETAAQTGDAARLTEQFAGSQAKTSAQVEILRQRIGVALQPALLSLMKTVTPIIESLSVWIQHNPKLSSGVILVTTGVVGLIAVLGTLGFAITALGPVFTAFRVGSIASIAAVSTSFKGLSALVASRLFMPALVVTAAIVSLNQVWKAIQSVRQAISDLNAAKRSATNLREGNRAILSQMQALLLSGDAGQRSRAQKVINDIKAGKYGAYASGTDYAPGGWSLVGEQGPELMYVPRGAQIKPAGETKEMLSQPVQFTQNNHIYNNVDMTAANRDLGWRLAHA